MARTITKAALIVPAIEALTAPQDPGPSSALDGRGAFKYRCLRQSASGNFRDARVPPEVRHYNSLQKEAYHGLGISHQ
jgi:hypothetical protein